MNYTLNKSQPTGQHKVSMREALTKLSPLLADEKKYLALAFFAITINSVLILLAPLLIGYAVDAYVVTRQYRGVLLFSGILLAMFFVALVAGYLQTKSMGGVGQRVLFKLRNAVFHKLQQLPVAFFNQNKAGDLISRINNDTDKLNQFFSQYLMQFVGSIFIMLGAGIFLLVLNLRLGLATLVPALLLVIFTQTTGAWVKRKNAVTMQALGGMSSEIQESLNNFKAIIAFNRRDYFRKRFNETNQQNYKSAITAGLINNIFTPIYGLCANLAQLIVLALGLTLIISGHLTIGFLISFLSYANSFYQPLKQLASVWPNFQTALAGWDRVSEILALESNLTTIEAAQTTQDSLITFQNVAFSYPDGKQVLHDINFSLEKGKTYALVGPTGGGKTTTASLIARLYDPTSGTIFLHGKDIRSYSAEERTKKIGFILQEPFLFTGTVRENILYGNDAYHTFTNQDLEHVLREAQLNDLLRRFEKGLDTPVLNSGDTMSLGQRQLIAFIRAVLRHPEILILDEATANIDTVTEQLLEDILKKLPPETTRVIIAHRLNTIENADEIFFVNGGEVIRAGSMDHAVDMLMNKKRES